MTVDQCVESIDRVTRAGREACRAVETALEALLVGGELRQDGRSMVDIVDDMIARGGREMRLSAAEAFRDYERAIASLRAVVVKTLVDEEGLSLTSVAQRMKISRQAASRLYQSAPEPPEGGHG